MPTRINLSHQLFGVLCLFTLVLTSCSTAHATTYNGGTLSATIQPQSGCGKTPMIPAATSRNETIRVNGLVRAYRLHIPADYNSRHHYPFILNFHGHGSNSRNQEYLTGMSRLADGAQFIVAYPQGTIGRDHLTGWNTGPARYPHVNDIQFTSDIINNVEANLCINTQRIYAAGFSNGGGMVNTLACTLSTRIAAFAIVSGGMHPVAGGCHPQRPVSLIEFHGTSDHTVPYTGNKSNDDEPPIQSWLQSWVKLDAANPQATIFYKRSGVLGERWTTPQHTATIIHYRIQGEGHQWPTITFQDSNGHTVNATELIWQFFQAHSLAAAAKTV
jgi:Poly(3-hydroxybutyrate) depolymerase